MTGRPAKTAEPALCVGAHRQRFRELVAAGSDDAVAPVVHAQLVRLVEHDEVVAAAGLSKYVEHLLAGQRVERHDHAVAVRAVERILRPDVCAAHDAEIQSKEVQQLPPPVADQARGRNDQHALEPLSRHHLADVETGHDRLAGAGVVGEQETERILLQHPLVHRKALVQQRIDARGLDRKGRVELPPERQPKGVGHGEHRLGIAREVQIDPGPRRRAQRSQGAHCRHRSRSRSLLTELRQLLEREPPGTRLPGLPTVDGDRRDAQPVGELVLSQAEPAAKASYVGLDLDWETCVGSWRRHGEARYHNHVCGRR